jgi:hypothetical protein
MVFEHLWNVSDLKESANNFIQFHQLNSHVAMDCFLRSIVHILGVIKLLILAKPSNDIKLIAMGKVLYQLVSRALCLQLRYVFSYHLLFH